MVIRRLILACAVTALVGVATPAKAQKGGKPAPQPSATPVTADLRCPAGPDCLSAERIDRIAGDGLGAYVGNSRGEGAFFNENNKLDIHYTTSYGRSITLDFDDLVAGGSCASTLSCRKNFAFAQVFSTVVPSITNPIDESQTALPNGFYDIAVGGSTKARLKLDFPDPAGRALHWTVRFNAEFYSGSTDLTVTRTGDNTWIVEASASDVAELVAINTGKGKTIMTREGFYTMPFRITVTR